MCLSFGQIQETRLYNDFCKVKVYLESFRRLMELSLNAVLLDSVFPQISTMEEL